MRLTFASVLVVHGVIHLLGFTKAFAFAELPNGTAQSLLRSGKSQEAIELLKMNVRLYPTSAFALTSLAEGYVAAGQKDLAVQNYEKGLKLDPKNEGARSALAKLKTP